MNAWSVSDQIIVEQLMGFHGADWKSYVKTEADRQSVKSTLESIIYKKFDFGKYNFTDEASIESLRQSAITQYGHFVSVDENGNISDSDRNTIDQIADEAEFDGYDSHKALAFYETLSYIGTPEMLEKLSGYLEKAENLSTDYTVAGFIDQALNGYGGIERDPNVDNSYINPYNPNVKDPFYERGGDWKDSLDRISDNVKDSYKKAKKKSKDKYFLESFEKYASNLKGAGKQLKKHQKEIKATSIDSDNNPNNNSNSRSIASDEDKKEEINREPSSQDEGPSSNGWLYGVFLLVILGSLLFFIFKFVIK